MTPETPPAADFATILSAAVHDMKNSLQLLLQSMSTVAEELGDTPAARSLADIQYEAQRLNTGLIQLLSLYRNEHTSLPVNLESQLLDELLEDLVADAEFYSNHYAVTIDLDVPANLAWYLDKALVSVLLQDVLINALRYANQRVSVRAFTDEGQLHVEIRDDGPGYPAAVIERIARNAAADEPSSTLLQAGRTGLGLYFAGRIASAHQRQEQSGSIQLGNDRGSIFTLRLP